MSDHDSLDSDFFNHEAGSGTYTAEPTDTTSLYTLKGFLGSIGSFHSGRLPQQEDLRHGRCNPDAGSRASWSCYPYPGLMKEGPTDLRFNHDPTRREATASWHSAEVPIDQLYPRNPNRPNAETGGSMESNPHQASDSGVYSKFGQGHPGISAWDLFPESQHTEIISNVESQGEPYEIWGPDGSFLVPSYPLQPHGWDMGQGPAPRYNGQPVETRTSLAGFNRPTMDGQIRAPGLMPSATDDRIEQQRVFESSTKLLVRTKEGSRQTNHGTGISSDTIHSGRKESHGRVSKKPASGNRHRSSNVHHLTLQSRRAGAEAT